MVTETTKSISLMLADDHPAMLSGLASLLLEALPNIKIIGLAQNGEVLLNLIKLNEPDIVLLDLEMPVMDGFEALDKISFNYPNVKSIIFSTHYEDAFKNELILSGARSYLPKNADVDVLIETINKVYTEGYFFESTISKQLISKSFQRKFYEDEWKKIGLTKRELEVLKLICDEKSNIKIAELLAISVNTVDFHRKNIYEKANTTSVIGLVKYAVRVGLA